MKDVNILTVLLSLASGVITAIASYLLNSKKTRAEVDKIRAETDKIIAETKNLSIKIDTALETKNNEVVYYDGTNPVQFDFKIERQRNYDNVAKKEIGEKAGGDFSIIDNILNIERTDNNGRFTVTIQSYTKSSVTSDCIKVDPTIGQQRKFQVTCEMKSLKSHKHKLDFVLRNIDSFEWIANKEFIVQSYEWTKFEAFFRVTPDRSFRLKIYDKSVENPPSSIQIRNLKIVEKF
ncbi:MAG TPA: hypothetical protein VIU12_33070 [Chryseolinea sp.]